MPLKEVLIRKARWQTDSDWGSSPLPHLFPRLHQLLDRPRAGEMPRSDPTDHERTPVEILDSGLAHHREASLQLGQIFPAEHFVRRSGTPGHDAGILSDSLFIRLCARINKTVRGMTRNCGFNQDGQSDKAKAIRKLDAALSKLVGSRDGASTTCGRGDVPLDAGHYRRRECMATRFDYRNLAGHCKEENCSEGGKSYEGGIATDTNFG
jgi:hypothetical protein